MQLPNFSIEPENVKYIIVKAKELAKGDVIIHNYSTFRIDIFNLGLGAGNEFGNYIRVIGKWINTDEDSFQGIDDQEFWMFENCPVVKVVKSND